MLARTSFGQPHFDATLFVRGAKNEHHRPQRTHHHIPNWGSWPFWVARLALAKAAGRTFLSSKTAICFPCNKRTLSRKNIAQFRAKFHSILFQTSTTLTVCAPCFPVATMHRLYNTLLNTFEVKAF